MPMYDGHVHTVFSHDGKATLEAQCIAAKEKGLSGITVTEHSYPPPKGFAFGENIRASVEEGKRLREIYGKDFQILCGIEIADLFLDGCDNAVFYAMNDIDCLLGSVHSSAVIRKFFPDCGIRSLVGNGDSVSKEFALRFTERYFLELLKTAEEGDVDVLAHLTYPFRYFNGDGKMELCISDFYGITDEILKTMIKRDMALEVNTSGFARGWDECMPNEMLLRRYFKLGGRRITLGSDAHKTMQLAVGIPEATKMLKEIGFTRGTYYVHRFAQEYTL